MTNKPLHVLIAGGGLSGLALAQGLIKDGHTCELFERDADDSRKIGYYLHMNADGGEALRRCLPADLFELYAETSRRTYERRESVVLDDQLNELSSQPHLGPPNEGERPHTGVHRRTLRAILRARLGGSFHPGHAVAGYKETPSGVFSFSKAIDTFCPIGPWIVTKDEVPDAQALPMELRVNGQVRQRGNTAKMLISIPHLVAYHSAQGFSAGDILTTGTISGVAAVQPNPFEFYLQPGDNIEAEIEGIGVLRNHVVPWSAAHDTPPYSTDLYSSTG